MELPVPTEAGPVSNPSSSRISCVSFSDNGLADLVLSISYLYTTKRAQSFFKNTDKPLVLEHFRPAIKLYNFSSVHFEVKNSISGP